MPQRTQQLPVAIVANALTQIPYLPVRMAAEILAHDEDPALPARCSGVRALLRRTRLGKLRLPAGTIQHHAVEPATSARHCVDVIGGLRYLPAVVVTIFVADVVIRHAPGGYEVTAMTALTLAGGYAVIAHLLRMLLSPTRALHSTRHLTVFSAVTIGGTAIVSAAFIAVLWTAAFLTETSLLNAWLQFWVGDSVGVLVTAPLLLAAADAQSRRELFRVAQRPETMIQAVALAATVWMVFVGLPGDPAQHFYLLFLPLIWIALRGGMSGALIAVTIVQLGVVVAIHRDATHNTAGARASGVCGRSYAYRALPRNDGGRTTAHRRKSPANLEVGCCGGDGWRSSPTRSISRLLH